MKLYKIIASSIFLLLFTSSCGLLVKSILEVSDYFNNSAIFRQGQHGELTKEELEKVKIAWKYFENNNSESGVPASIDKGNYFSSWDISSYLSALISAHKLQLISDAQFDERISRFLTFINTIPLYKNELPNKFYNLSGKMLDKEQKNGIAGVSFSDIGRILIWLKILKTNYPQYSEYIDKAVLKWKFCSLIKNCTKNSNYEKFYNDGFFVENYAKKGFILWGFQPKENYSFEDLRKIKIDDTIIYFDRYNQQNSKTIDAVYSYPHILEGLEFNWDLITEKDTFDSLHTDKKLFEIANSVYKIQEKRYIQDKVFTAKDLVIINNKPFIIYDTIFAEGYKWNTLSDKGEYFPDLAMVSVKAVFGLWTLWKTEYTEKLMDLMENLYDPQRGWYEGRYEKTSAIEKTISLQTNSLILESYYYKKKGKIYVEDKRDTLYNKALKNEFSGYNNSCFPTSNYNCK